jgi:hypothetical protein
LNGRRINNMEQFMVSRKTFPFLLLSTILWAFSAGSGA